MILSMVLPESNLKEEIKKNLAKIATKKPPY